MGLEQILSDWGLVAVFFGCFFEGETAAILGGVISHRGFVHWAETASVASLGAYLADQMWFQLARHLPQQSWLGQKITRLRQAPRALWLHEQLTRRGTLIALATRFIPGTRILGPVLLAHTKMGGARFAALNAASCAIWAMLFTALGYHFGKAAEGILGRLEGHHFGWMLLGLAALLLFLHLWFRHRAKARG